MKRRGLLAGAAALVAGIVAKQASQPVAAAPISADYFVASGSASSSFETTGAPLIGVNVSGVVYGVSAVSNGGYGVYGLTTSPANGTFAGVRGDANGGTTFGVVGDGAGAFKGAGTGVLGQDAQYAVVGKPATTGGTAYNPANSIGVLGDNRSKASGGIGVEGVVQGGTASTTGTIGVYGANLNPAPNSHGIIGLAQNGHGLVGTCNATSNLLAGLVGNAPNGANAGNFFGNVAVTGSLFVGGSQTVAGAKSAALAHPDGSHRLVYCVEAPESWLEDFGTGTLAAGTAEVRFDPDFAAVAEMSDYHVFLTEYGESNGLYVANRSASGFAVQEKNKGVGSGTFSWRVVAKRRDVKAGRLARYAIPQLTPPVIPPPHVPDLPTPPTRP